MTNIEYHPQPEGQPAAASGQRSRALLYLGVAVVLAVVAVPGLRLLAFVAPIGFLAALFVPKVHRLPGLARAAIYLVATASLLWLGFLGLLIYALSRPGTHFG